MPIQDAARQALPRGLCRPWVQQLSGGGGLCRRRLASTPSTVNAGAGRTGALPRRPPPSARGGPCAGGSASARPEERREKRSFYVIMVKWQPAAGVFAQKTVEARGQRPSNGGVISLLAAQSSQRRPSRACLVGPVLADVEVG